MNTGSKFKLKEVNKKCKDVVENMPADMPVEYLRTATKRICNTPILDINKPDEANFFRSSTKFWSAKHNLTAYETNIFKRDLEEFAQNNVYFKDIVNKILKMDIFGIGRILSISGISEPEEVIKLLVNEFEIKNPDYFKENETTKDNILNHILEYYLMDEYFYCPVGEKLTESEEIDKIAMPVLKYIELFFSDFNIFRYSETFDKFFAKEPTITFDIANKYSSFNLSKNPQGAEQYEKILSNHEIAKRVLGQLFKYMCNVYMNLVILYEQEIFPEELKFLASSFINTIEALINAVFVEKNKNTFDIKTFENICKSDLVKKLKKDLDEDEDEDEEYSTYRQELARVLISILDYLENKVKDLKSGKYDQLIKYLNS